MLGTDQERLPVTWTAKDAGNNPDSVDHVRSMSELKSSTTGDGKKMECVPHQLTAGSAIAHLHSRIFRFLVSRACRSRTFPANLPS